MKTTHLYNLDNKPFDSAFLRSLPGRTRAFTDSAETDRTEFQRRPGAKRLLAAIKAGDTVIASSASSLGSTTVRLHTVLSLFFEKQVHFRTQTTAMPIAPKMFPIALRILEAFRENRQESAQAAVETRMRRKHRPKVAPIGMEWKTIAGQPRLIQCKDTWKVIQRIRQLQSAGESLDQICFRFHKERVTRLVTTLVYLSETIPRQYHHQQHWEIKKQNGEWSRSAIARSLKLPNSNGESSDGRIKHFD